MPQKRFHKITWEGEGWLFNTIFSAESSKNLNCLYALVKGGIQKKKSQGFQHQENYLYNGS
jgi:hypothetical protein